MREIKFRAWNKEKKEMVYAYPLWKEETGCIMSGWDNYHCDNLGYYQQYTDLKDKNGKEIYEGDIVKTKFWYHAFFGDSKDTHFVEEEFIGAIEYWGEYHASFNIIEGDYTGAGSIPLEWACHKNDGWKIYGEIIGNIYEDPDLLKD